MITAAIVLVLAPSTGAMSTSKKLAETDEKIKRTTTKKLKSHDTAKFFGRSEVSEGLHRRKLQYAYNESDWSYIGIGECEYDEDDVTFSYYTSHDFVNPDETICSAICMDDQETNLIGFETSQTYNKCYCLHASSNSTGQNPIVGSTEDNNYKCYKKNETSFGGYERDEEDWGLLGDGECLDESGSTYKTYTTLSLVVEDFSSCAKGCVDYQKERLVGFETYVVSFECYCLYSSSVAELGTVPIISSATGNSDYTCTRYIPYTGDWYIKGLGITAAFDDGSAYSEVELKHLISNRSYEQTIMDYNCNNNTTCDVDCPFSITTADSDSGGLTELTTIMDINQSSVVTSTYWTNSSDGTNGTIRFCMRTDLLLGDESITFKEQAITLNVDMKRNFAIDSIETTRDEAQDVETSTKVDYDIIAYTCDATDSTPTSPTLSQDNNKLIVCVKTNETSTSGVYVSDVIDFSCTQGGDKITQFVTNFNPDLLTLKDCDGGICTIQGVASSKYFDQTTPLPLDCTGDALLSFGTARRRTTSRRGQLLVNNNNNIDTTSRHRSHQKGTQSKKEEETLPFGLSIPIIVEVNTDEEIGNKNDELKMKDSGDVKMMTSGGSAAATYAIIAATALFVTVTTVATTSFV